MPHTAQLLLDIIDTIREPLLVLDPEFRVTHANREFCRVFRVDPHETIGCNLFQLGNGQWDIPALRELLRDKLTVEPRLDDFEVDHVFPDIGRKIMLLNARFVGHDADAALIGPDAVMPRTIVLAFEDITARRFADWRLAAQHSELLRSNAALMEFASVASHDLQEPLRKILTFGERLNSSSKDVLVGDSRVHLDRMLSAAARMRTLVRDLLTYSQVATRVEPFVRTDLAVIAREVVVDLEAAITDGAKVEIGELPTLEADPLQMRQLLQNLLGNALKYKQKDTPAHVRLDSYKSDSRHYTITVKDNGIGFNNEYSEKIFKMFERLHGRMEYAGSGIGLAICSQIVKRHGGTIAAVSRPNDGATFSVTLPASQVISGLFS